MTKDRSGARPPSRGGALTWRVTASDGDRVRDVLAKMGATAASAADDGRAFIAGRRVAPDDRIAVGDDLVVHAARAAADDVVTVLATAPEFVAVDKPAGLPTTPDRRGEACLLHEVARALSVSSSRLHAASRLDVGVSGAVLIATTDEGARQLAAAREAGVVRRLYVAIAAGELDGEGTWSAPIGEKRAPGGRRMPAASGVGARPASTLFRVVARAEGAVLLALTPVTGRTHQLRVHAALAGAPLLGDRDHGGPRQLASRTGRVVSCGDRIALHAHRVEIEPLSFVAVSPIPAAMRALWTALGGDDAAWSVLA